ncbi:hypothetical protein BH09PSE5_BH09PSE5_12680 [soil metagenome]
MSAPSNDDERTVTWRSSGTDPTLPRQPVPARNYDDDHGHALPIGTLIAEFEITRVLGQGGFGIVYLAQDSSLHRPVALKEYMPSTLASRRTLGQVSVRSPRHRETFEKGLASFVNEARLLAQFDHPSLVKVYRFWEGNGTAYMAMPFYEGVTLKERLRILGGPPDEESLMKMLGSLTEALMVMHAERCYHRDIAPDNIILLANGDRPLLLDFGAARKVIGGMTQALTVILKPGYAPLEQYAEMPGMEQGPWTDVYALAAVVYSAIAGRTPPPSVSRVLTDTFEPLSTIAAHKYSPRLLGAIDRALAVRPQDRTGSIVAFREELGLSSSVSTLTSGTDATTDETAFKPMVAIGMTPADDPSFARTIVLDSLPSARVDSVAVPDRRKLWIGVGAAAILVAGVAVVTFGSRPNFVAPAPLRAEPVDSATVAVAPPDGASQASQSWTNAAGASAATWGQLKAPEPVPTAQADAARPFVVRTEFDRVIAGRTPGFEVSATGSRPTYRIGKDMLSFNLKSNRAGYVYVLMSEPSGSLLMFFPNSVASDNKVAAFKSLVLPQASWPLQTSAPAVEVRFLVIVSETPRDFSAFGGHYHDWFLQLPTGDELAALARDAGGSGPVLAGKSTCAADGCDRYGAAGFVIDIVN